MARDNVDERVVQLMLDSKEFDSNAKKSIQSLDDLKKALEFEGSSKGFEAIERAARKVDFSIMDNGIQKVQDHFNLLNTVATTAIERITNSAIDSGTRLVKALSVDQITQGWSQFEDRTTAMQRIMSATTSQFSDEEEQIEAVNEQMEKLVWFTDETSYKYLDIVNSIGKFTANNIDLKESVKAMEGISTWASLSGASIEESGRAMYNLAQAMSAGAVTKQDWNSVASANMGTYEFKKTAIEAALAVGTLTETMDGLYKAGDKVYSDLELFNEGLAKRWFSSDVLMETLSRYGGFTDLLNEFMNAVEEEGFYTASALSIIDDYVDGHLDMADAMEQTGMSAEELTSWLEKLGSEEMELGRKGFKAAQETKTLSEAIDYIKTAVSSGWARSFQYIFGDYNEAKKWWSEVSEALYSVFVESGEARNELLKFWKEAGGRDTLLDGIRTLAKNIYGVIESIKGAWNNIFGKDFDEQVKSLLNFTEGFRNFAEAISFTDDTFRNFLRILESVFRVFKTFGRTASTVITALEPLARTLNKIAGAFLGVIADVAEFASFKFENIFNSTRVEAFAKSLETVAKVVSVLLYRGFESLIDVVDMVIAGLKTLYNIFEQYTGGFDVIFLKLANSVWDFWNAFEAGETFANKVIDTILSILGGGVGGVMLLIQKIIAAFKGTKFEGESFGNLSDWLTKVKDAFESINLEEKLSWFINAFSLIASYIGEFFRDIQNVDSELRKTLGLLGGELKIFYEWFKRIITEMSAEDIAKVGMMVAMIQLIMGVKNLTVAFKNLSNASKGVVTTVDNLLKGLSEGKAESLMSKISGVFAKTRILQIGIGVTMLAAAFNQLNKMDYAQTTRSLVLLLAAMGTLLVIFKKWNDISAVAAERGNATDGGKVGLMVLEIGAAMLAFSYAITNISKALEGGVDGMDQVLPAIFGLTLMGAALVGMIAVLNKIKAGDLTKTAASMLLIATSITMLTVPLAVLSKMDFLSMMGGLIGVAGLLVSVGTAMYMMQSVDWKTMLTSAVAFGALAAALTLLAVPVLALGKMGEGFGSGLAGVVTLIISLGAAIGLLGVFCQSVDPKLFVTLSTAFIAFASAITLMSVAAIMIQGVDLWPLVGVITAMIVPLTALVGIAAYFSTVLPILPAIIESVSLAIMRIGVSFLAAGAGALMLSTAFQVISAGIVALGLAATVFGDGFPEIIKKGVAAVGIILDGLLDIILSLAPKIALAVGTIIATIKAAKWYNQLDDEFVKKVVAIGLAVIAAISSFGDPLFDALIEIIDVINRRMPELISAVAELIRTFGAANGILILAMINGVVDMIFAFLFGEKGREIRENTGKFINDAIAAIPGMLADGIAGIAKLVASAGEWLGNLFHGGWADAQDPVAEMDLYKEDMKAVGKNIKEGTEKYAAPSAAEAGNTTGTAYANAFESSALNGVSNAMGNVKSVMGESLDDMLKSFDSVIGSSSGLVSWQWGGKKLYNNVAGDYSRYDKYGSTGAIEVYKPPEKDSAESKELQKEWSDFGSSLGSSGAKGVASGAKQEKEKTAEEIVNEYLQAISDAYSRGVERLDVSASRLSLKDKLWNLTNKEPGEKATEAEKKSYELAKKAHQVEMLDQQMSAQLMKINLAEADYREKLNILGSEAIETQKAYNSLLEEQYNILDLYSQKQELMAEESESTADDFIAASKEISSYRELVEKNLITEEMMMNAAKDKLKAFRKEESDFAKTHTTELDNVMSGILEKLPEYGYDLNKAFGTIVTENFIEAFDNAGENTNGLENSLVETVVKTIETATNDPKLIEASEGSGINYVQGLVSGTEKMKDTFVDASQVVAKDGLNAMAKELDINSPSRKTDQFGQWLDEGLANGLLNDSAVTKVLNAADTIARKLLARLKAKLGVSSPSTETYAIAKWLDIGAANGITDYSDIVMKSSDKMVGNLLDNMKSQIAQNGSEMKTYLKDSFGLADDDLRFTVIVDADTSLADASLTELERAYAISNSGNVQLPNFIAQGANMRDLYSRLNESDTYRASELQSLYDLVDSYVSYQKRKESRDAYEEESKPEASSISFTQNNYSPRSISALDTYRNTKKQLSTFEQKIKDIRIRK